MLIWSIFDDFIMLVGLQKLGSTNLVQNSNQWWFCCNVLFFLLSVRGTSLTEIILSDCISLNENTSSTNVNFLLVLIYFYPFLSYFIIAYLPFFSSLEFHFYCMSHRYFNAPLINENKLNYFIHIHWLLVKKDCHNEHKVPWINKIIKRMKNHIELINTNEYYMINRICTKKYCWRIRNALNRNINKEWFFI